MNELHNEVYNKIQECINKFNEFVKLEDQYISRPTVKFDLKGTTAGQANYTRNHLRINESILNEYKEKYINRTVVHEMAHFLTRWLYTIKYNMQSVSPHGKEWKNVMRILGTSNPTRCHNYNVTPARKTRNFAYTCNCNKIISVGLIRHNRALKGTKYCCGVCHSTINYTGKEIV